MSGPTNELRQFLKRRIVVRLDGCAVAGTLVSLGAASLVLNDAELVEISGERFPMSGLVLVERPRVLWIQIPDDTEESP